MKDVIEEVETLFICKDVMQAPADHQFVQSIRKTVGGLDKINYFPLVYLHNQAFLLD